MSKLPPISAPLERRWREFRYQYLPFVAFGVCVLGTITLWREFALPHGPVSAKPTAATVATPAVPNSQGSIATVSPATFNTALITNPPPALSD